jgi:hypothetical protein
MAGRHLARIMVLALVGCSTFGSTSSEAPKPDGGPPSPAVDGGTAGPIAEAGAGDYNPAAEIACEQMVCHPPDFCCASTLADNVCARSGCLDTGQARLRCTSFDGCAPGLFCCLRLTNYVVQSVTCEKDCPKRAGGDGVIQLCGDGDANKRCPGACVPITDLINGTTLPDFGARGCQ